MHTDTQTSLFIACKIIAHGTQDIYMSLDIGIPMYRIISVIVLVEDRQESWKEGGIRENATHAEA